VRIGLVLRGGADRSGRERVIPAMLWLIERIARRHELHVFALDHSPQPCSYPLLGATVHDLGRPTSPRGFRRRVQLSRLSSALTHLGQFDVLHAYWALPAGVVATLAARRLGVPAIVTADSGEWVSIPERQYGLQRRWVDRRGVAAAMRRATRVTVCTEHMARLAARHAVCAEVIPLGVPRPGAAAALRVDPPPWRLLHVASINRVKDHDTLLRAFGHVARRLPQVHLDVVGEDTLGGSAQRLAARIGLQSRVTFHGFQPNDALSAFYERAHLHVISSRHEAAGVVVLEAAAAGVATVGTRVGYVDDWSAADPPRAAAVPPGDAAALADAIVALLLSPARRESLAAAAREWTLAHDADWTAAQFDHLYRDVARSG
jgi:glycosyltransferase involved in cell wall biosynthesis